MDDLIPVPRPPNAPAAQPPYYVANPYDFRAPDDPDGEVGLFQYWEVICRNKGKIALTSLAGLLVGFCVGFLMKPVYRASTTIEVLAMNQNFMNMRDTYPVDSSTDSDVSEEQTQAELMTSAMILKRVTAKLASAEASANTGQIPHSPLDKVWKRVDPAWTWVRELVINGSASGQYEPISLLSQRALLVAKTAQTLKTKTIPHTRIIQATIESSDRRLAAAFLNNLSAEFLAQNQESRLVTTEHTGDWIARELDDAKSKLRQSEETLQDYARTEGLVYTSETSNVSTEKLLQYQQSLSAATTDRISKQARFELAQNSPPDSLADILNDATLRETQSRIADLKRQAADLITVYKPEYEKVRRVNAELQTMQAAFDHKRADVLSRIRTDYEEAASKEKLLSEAYDQQTVEVTGQGQKAIQYNILKREVDSNRQLYDAMLTQMKQASIATAMRASNVRVVDPAEAPKFPVSPSFPLNSALGMASGLMLSTIMVLIRTEANRTLQAQGDIKLYANLPELGTIPNARGSSKAYYLHNTDKVSGSRGRHNHSISAPVNRVDLAAWQGRATLLAESFRLTLTSILVTGESGKRPKVLVFASGIPAEGKTTAVTNIAIAASEMRMKVLVIDGDLRRPRVHQIFGLPNECGLADCLRNDLTEEEVSKLVRLSTVPNLHVLTAGPETSAAAQLLYSPNLEALIRRFRLEYDMVLIDTPPMLQMTDARIISRQSDGVVLVARAGKTPRETLLAAKERFLEDGVFVVGSILNDWNPNLTSDKYYYRGNYRRRYQY